MWLRMLLSQLPIWSSSFFSFHLVLFIFSVSEVTVVTTHLEYFKDVKPIVIKLGKDINSIFESDH